MLHKKKSKSFITVKYQSSIENLEIGKLSVGNWTSKQGYFFCFYKEIVDKAREFLVKRLDLALITEFFQ